MHYSYAQGELNDEQKAFYRNELTGYVQLNSSGIGIGSRYAKHVYALKKRVYNVQIASIKHPKEIKLSSPTGKMVYGKLNSAFTIMASQGQHTEKFSKFDKNSIAISFVYHYGAALAIEKPVYYYIQYPDVVEQFNTSNHAKYGKAPFRYGLKETHVIPGAVCSYSILFEFSKNDEFVQSIEFGGMVHAYFRKIQIMHSYDNSWIYPSVYVSYHLGKLVQK